MDELTSKLKTLIIDTMNKYLTAHRAPSPDELLKIADAVTQYDHATRIRQGYLKDQSDKE